MAAGVTDTDTVADDVTLGVRASTEKEVEGSIVSVDSEISESRNEFLNVIERGFSATDAAGSIEGGGPTDDVTVKSAEHDNQLMSSSDAVLMSSGGRTSPDRVSLTEEGGEDRQGGEEDEPTSNESKSPGEEIKSVTTMTEKVLYRRPITAQEEDDECWEPTSRVTSRSFQRALLDSAFVTVTHDNHIVDEISQVAYCVSDSQHFNNF